jgi:hypothetical protein
MDHLFLSKDQVEQTVQEWGVVGDNIAWCLSADPNLLIHQEIFDDKGVEIKLGGCFSGIRFDVSDGGSSVGVEGAGHAEGVYGNNNDD